LPERIQQEFVTVVGDENGAVRMVREYAKAFPVKVVLVFVRDENLQCLAGASLSHDLAQVAIGRPLVPASRECAVVIEPWIDEQGLTFGFYQKAVMTVEREIVTHD
jgi:acetylornithine deacetylase/succinyl-diaminopimelate desuccinylase-like protein